MKSTVVVDRFGRERMPVVVVENLHPDPLALRAAAAGAAFGPARHHYPGLRADLPPGYLAAVWPLLSAAARDVFGHGRGLELIDASFSLVTRPPPELTAAQRLPHADAPERGRLAMVHFLALDGGAGGTAFFRHKATGFEYVDRARTYAYGRALSDELLSAPPPPAYAAGDGDLFERTGLVEAGFNRAVIYRSAMLHSGAIPPGATLSADPERGRLTVTGFLAAS